MAELSLSQKRELIKALKKHYKADVAYGKGGFFVRGKGHITISKARKITGIKASRSGSESIPDLWRKISWRGMEGLLPKPWWRAPSGMSIYWKR